MTRALAIAALLALACATTASGPETVEWPLHGLTPSEARFSPLDQIDEASVGRLGLAWSLELGTKRGLEATPILVEGVLYVTGTWSVVSAVDARTGRLLWRHDPQVPRRETASKACCDVVNRGVAVHGGRVFAGTLDGRLLALDAATGAVVWEKLTVDPALPYSITGAPRVVKGKAVIGNGGAEYGVRGYVTAYDAATGDQAWRFYTVPGDPSRPFEHAELERAAETWTGEWWKVGGGGTVWDSMAFDPELDLLYVGTGNGSPWSRHVRSPGGGDNLFLSSILALRPDTGELVWHYQTTPGDRFDYTATQHMILADLEIDGRTRPVLMQAPKNGFFYVLDRASGELVSAAPYAGKVTWAKGVGADGRPVEVDFDLVGETAEIWPSTKGGHNWQPMAFHPETGLVYVPAIENATFYRQDPDFAFIPGTWNVGYGLVPPTRPIAVSGHLLAWDPVAQQEAWRVELPNAWNGGVLATAGNLVFQGTGTRTFAAYRASDGAKLWETDVPSGIIAAPITYALDGRQYVAVLSGWGGGFSLNMGPWAAAAGNRVGTPGRLLVFALDADAPMPVDAIPEVEVAPIDAAVDPKLAQAGMVTYHVECAKCHGAVAVGGGTLPDLRMSKPAIYDALPDIVLRGALAGAGMPSFGDRLDEADVAALRAYLLTQRTALLASSP